MKSVTLHALKQELSFHSKEDLLECCIRLAKYKMENKELLIYLLFDANDEASYIDTVKLEMDELFEEINTTTYYYIKKSVRKILRIAKKHIRYSGKKETEVEILIHFCKRLLSIQPSITKNKVLTNLYRREYFSLQKSIRSLHEDLQYDFMQDLDQLKISSQP